MHRHRGPRDCLLKQEFDVQHLRRLATTRTKDYSGISVPQRYSVIYSHAARTARAISAHFPRFEASAAIDCDAKYITTRLATPL